MEECIYRIGQLAKLAGVSQRTVDYYTRLGLIGPMQRTEGNYRIYDERALQRLRLIKAMQAQRMPLAEIAKRLQEEPGELTSDIVDRLRAIGQDLAEAERRIALLAVAVASTTGREDVRRSVSRTANDALLHSLILAQYLAALVGEAKPFG